MNRPAPSVLSAARPGAGETIVRLRTFGITVRMRVPGDVGDGSPAVYEMMISAGAGLPKLRRPEAEIFHVITGRFVFEIDGHRVLARKGDLVFVPGGAARAFVNVTGTGARQQVTISPGIDSAAFFRDLADATDAFEAAALPSGATRLARVSSLWMVEFLGDPLPVDAAFEFGIEAEAS